MFLAANAERLVSDQIIAAINDVSQSIKDAGLDPLEIKREAFSYALPVPVSVTYFYLFLKTCFWPLWRSSQIMELSFYQNTQGVVTFYFLKSTIFWVRNEKKIFNSYLKYLVIIHQSMDFLPDLHRLMSDSRPIGLWERGISVFFVH